MTVEYDFSGPSDELKRIVHELGHLVNAKLTDSSWNSSQDYVARLR
jgi:hypothetical protein